MQWIKIALRNILKNRRRSFVTLTAIAFGFAAVSLFRGYTNNTYEGLRRSAIRGEGLGHLTIYKAGWLDKAHQDPRAYMLTPAEIEKITALAKADRHVLLTTPQLYVSGLVSNGRTSNIFLAKGVVPDDFRKITGVMADRRTMQGEDLRQDAPYAVLMARKLAKQLNIAPQNDAVIMAATLDGQMNALDIRVSGTYDTGSEATNDKYMLLPYQYAQTLYDTDRADHLVVLLDHWKYTETVRRNLEQALASSNLPCEIKTWKELSLFFNKVKAMFDMIFLFIFIIVLIIVVMSTINTMGMSVVERTREIGTLRVLGLKRRGVSFLFAMEGAILGLLGCGVGAALNVLAWAAIGLAGPSYVPPGMSSAVPLIVDLLPNAMLRLTLFLTLLSIAAAIFPARRAARMGIVDALGHV
jgi:putative ABC transport system permease protein